MTTTRTAWCAKCDGPVLCDERGCVACRVEKQELDRKRRTNGPIALAKFCAICIEGTEDLRPVQLEDDGPVFTVCKGCDESDAKTIASSPPRHPMPVRTVRGGTWQRKKYRPIDDTHRDLTFRILQIVGLAMGFYFGRFTK